MTRLILALLLASAAPSHALDACAPIQQIVSALKVQGYSSRVVMDRETVEKGIAFLEENGYRRGVVADGFLIVEMPHDELRLSLIREPCIFGMILMGQQTSKAFRVSVLGQVKGRDA